MKNVLIFTLEYPPQVGGVASYTKALADSLKAEHVYVLTAGERTADSDEPKSVLRRRLLSRMFWPRWIRTCRELWKAVRQYDIDTVLVHQVLPLGYACFAVNCMLKTRYMVFFHGTDIAYAQRSGWKRLMLKMVTGRAERLVANSAFMARRVARTLPETEHKLTTVYPCPDARFYAEPDRSRLENLKNSFALKGKRVVLSVSRMEDGKGYPHMADSMIRLVERRPDVVWLVVGDGSKREYILRMFQERSMQNAVRFAGSVAHTELVHYYHLADVFMLLSHPDEGCEEGFGLVFLEAAAAGLPVIAGEGGGTEEAVEHGHTGFVINARRHDMVVQILDDLFMRPEYARELGRNGRARARSQFVWEHQLENIG